MEERKRLPDSSADLLAPGYSNTVLITKAFVERWPMTQEVRQKAIERQADIAIDPDSSNKEATKAFMALIAADRVNAGLDKPATENHLHLHQEYGSLTTQERIERVRALLTKNESAKQVELQHG